MKEEIININDLYNLLYSKDNLKKCTIEITNQCNFRCPHCYVDKNDCKILNKEVIDKLLLELKNLGCLEITFSGGEPLSHPEFETIFESAKSLGFFVNINTNGSLITNKIIDLWCNNKPQMIEISLYGYDSISYDNFTKTTNNFAKVQSNIKRLVKNNIPFILKFTITRTNEKCIDNYISFCEENNYQYTLDYYVFPKDNDSGYNSELVEPEKIVNILKKHESTRNYIKNKVENLSVKDTKHMFQCSAGKDSIFIDVNGYINMCVSMRNKFFNVKNHKIIDALNYFKEIRLKPFDTNSPCKNCDKKSLCRFCPARFLAETGKMDSFNSWHCDIAKLMIKNFK